MREQIDVEPWNDEVCHSWIDQEIERTGNDTIEESAMPTAVLAFVKRLVREQYSNQSDDYTTRWIKANAIAQTRIISVDFMPADR